MNDYLLVHGAFCNGWMWSAVAKRLAEAGHRGIVVDQLPSGLAPENDLKADVAHVRDLLDAIDLPVVLVAHSYGGMVITEVADHPKIRHSVYVAAFWPSPGRTVYDSADDVPSPDHWVVPGADGMLRVHEDFDVANDVLCADLAPDRAREFLAHTGPQSPAAFVVPSTAPARTHPTTYVIADGADRCFPPEMQESMSVQADRVVRIPSAHMVQLSHTDEVAGILADIEI